MADFQAELPLYERSGALVAFLDNIRKKTGRDSTNVLSMTALIEELIVEMYEYDIVQALDVELSQAWLQDLFCIGYDPSDYLPQHED